VRSASFRRHSTLQEYRCEAEKAVHDLRTQLDTDPGAASGKHAAARRRPTEDRERRVQAAPALAPQDAAADAKGEAEEPASKVAREGVARLHDRGS
jgi:hypothetical protein